MPKPWVLFRTNPSIGNNSKKEYFVSNNLLSIVGKWYINFYKNSWPRKKKKTMSKRNVIIIIKSF